MLLAAPTVTVGVSSISATGGAGGTGLTDTTFPYTVASGGAGANGRVRVESTTAFSGTTSPAASTGSFVP